VEAISDLPMLNDIDADYSPQYVKLARILRAKIESGEYKTGNPVAAADLARDHNVSIKVAWSALAMLAANRYLARPGPFDPYHVTFNPATLTRGSTDEHARRRRNGPNHGDRARHAQRRADTPDTDRPRRPAPGTWRYGLSNGMANRLQYGHVAGVTGHLDVLRYAAGVCAAGYQPGTIERGLLEQFAVTGQCEHTDPRESHEQ
jgi:DNA-binding transcriptional MocR family regulator